MQVIFGAGQIGTPLASVLASLPDEVRIVSRSGRPAADTRVVAVKGDAMDAAFCRDVVRGASTVYHCMNPAYSAAAWETMLPRMQENLVAACAAAGARLVMLDNLYALGKPSGRVLDESTPMRPASRKGAIRARLDEALLAAHARGDVRAVIGRASDFFGPGLDTLFEARFWKRMLSGKGPQLIANPDMRHTYHYMPDVARGLAVLGAADNAAYGQAWMLPCEPAVTTRELIAKMAAALGREVPIRRVPRPMFAALKLFVPMLREVDEMLYQWDEPFVVDDRRFRQQFNVGATPLDQATRETVQWARGMVVN